MKPIVHAPLPVLAHPAKPVTRFDDSLQKLIKDMRDALLATVDPKGVGLAAVQIGEPWRVFLTKPSDKAAIRVFINPIITTKSTEATDPHTSGKLEGCLSVPKLWGKVRRATSLTINYQDETGKAHTESFTGFMATIIQHEVDHLDGILFTQRVLEQKGQFYKSGKNDKNEEVLEEVRFG